MAEIHHTTMAPTKVELLTAWLPQQPWYAGAGAPDLVRAGGFRLDDPDGEVGIEVMVVVDQAQALVRYLVPLTYRDAPLAGADAALIGTSEHGKLGTRFVYDGAGDPVFVGTVAALLRGLAEPQAQSISWTADPTVVVHGELSPTTDVALVDGPMQAAADGTAVARLVRVLQPDETSPAGCAVVAGWTLPDGTAERGPVLVVERQ